MRNLWGHEKEQHKCNELINNKLGTALGTLLRTYGEQGIKTLQCPFPPTINKGQTQPILHIVLTSLNA